MKCLKTRPFPIFFHRANSLEIEMRPQSNFYEKKTLTEAGIPVESSALGHQIVMSGALV
jgi:hypothetical protein